MFGNRGKISVVVDEHRQIEALGHHVGERDVGQRHIDRDDRDAGAPVDLGGDPETDRLDLIPGGFPHLLDSINRYVEQCGLIETRDGALRSVVYPEPRIYRSGQ